MNKLIINLAVLTAGVLILVFVALPLFSDINDKRQIYADKQNEKETIGNLIEKTERLQDEYQTMSEEINKFFIALPSERDVPQLLVNFETIAANNGLLFGSISFKDQNEDTDSAKGMQIPAGQSKKVKPFKSLTVDIEVSGGYEAFKNYLASLENNLRSMDVLLIEFKTSDSSGSSERTDYFDFNLGLDVYYSK